MDTVSAIYGFAEPYQFLSNLHSLPLGIGEYYQGEHLMYPTVEHAYQARKHQSLSLRQQIAACVSAYDARLLSWSQPCTAGWDNIRLQVMRLLLEQKFEDPELQDLLIGTQGKEIYQVNHWGEIFWGVNQYMVGENHLGRMLMEIRERLVLEQATLKAEEDSP